LITASLNGHLPVSISAASGAVGENAPAFFTSGGIAASSAAIPKPASMLRRVYSMCSSSAPLKMIEAIWEARVLRLAFAACPISFPPEIVPKLFVECLPHSRLPLL
jgi:hypothetical protein